MESARGRLWWEIVGVGLCEFLGQLLRGDFGVWQDEGCIELGEGGGVLMVISKVYVDDTGGTEMPYGDQGPASLFIRGIFFFCQPELVLVSCEY